MLLSLLVPAPFIHLSFAQPSLVSHFLHNILVPLRVVLKYFHEIVELVERFSLSSSNDSYLLILINIFLWISLFVGNINFSVELCESHFCLGQIRLRRLLLPARCLHIQLTSAAIWLFHVRNLLRIAKIDKSLIVLAITELLTEIGSHRG